MSGSAWATKSGVQANALDWFAQRLVRARALMPTANFDTVIREDFENDIDSEFVGVVGVATADPVRFYNAGVVAVNVGDAVIATNRGRLQATGDVGGGPPSHVGNLAGKSWYAASLVRIIRPTDAALGETACDAVALWGDDTHRVGLGIQGEFSGGSTTNWVGYSDNAGSVATVLGPALDGEESPVWHLFEQWFNVVTGKLSFALDEITFAATIDVANIPGVPASWGMISRRDTAGDAFAANYDKVAVVVASPRVGGID